ncbi:hypothetical protein HAX54_021873 [Datura stramonium]|uniref:Uncharacterized protein n=1 Tax=Datura stramonium TaxID=4076 RepID=A0ABS8UVW0_DATST|nr:hypothetical protein [Datura stramonium]
METSPYSLSPEEESTGNPSPTSLAPIDLSTLISDIQNKYSPHESVPKSPSPKRYTLTHSASIYAASDDPPDNVFLSDSESGEDLVPIVALKKGAWKRIFASGQAMSPASHTLARRKTQGGTIVIPKPIVPQYKVKPFFERKLLKGKMVFPCFDPCLADLWLKIEAQR